MRVFLRYGLLLITLLLFFVQCTEDKDIIAKVGPMKITVKEYRKELRKHYPHQNLKEISLDDKKAVLDKLLNFKRKVNAAYDLGLDEDEKINNNIKNQRDRMIGNKYYEKVIVDRLVTEEAIKSYLEKQHSENSTMDYSKDEDGLQVIKQKLYQVYSDSARALWRQHYQGLKNKYSFELQKENINKITTVINEHIKDKKLDLNSFNQDQLKIKLATWDGGSIKFIDILNRYGEGFSSVLPRLGNSKSLEREIDGQALLQIVLRDAEQYNIGKNDKIKEETTAMLEAMMVQLVEKKEVEEKAVYSEDEVFEYYQKHPEKFIKHEEIEIWEIFVEDESLAKSILSKAKAGQDFSQLAQKYSQDKSYAPKGGYIGYRYINGRGTVSREAFKIGPGGKIGGPVKYRKGWVILKTGAKNEESIKSFDSVKKLAESYVYNERIAENRVKWEKELEEEYPIKIYNDKLREI